MARCGILYCSACDTLLYFAVPTSAKNIQTMKLAFRKAFHLSSSSSPNKAFFHTKAKWRHQVNIQDIPRLLSLLLLFNFAFWHRHETWKDWLRCSVMLAHSTELNSIACESYLGIKKGRRKEGGLMWNPCRLPPLPHPLSWGHIYSRPDIIT